MDQLLFDNNKWVNAQLIVEMGVFLNVGVFLAHFAFCEYF